MGRLFDELASDACEFLVDFRENYADTYWWIDHPVLRITLMSVAAGMIGLAFHYAQLRMDHRMGASNAA